MGSQSSAPAPLSPSTAASAPTAAKAADRKEPITSPVLEDWASRAQIVQHLTDGLLFPRELSRIITSYAITTELRWSSYGDADGVTLVSDRGARIECLVESYMRAVATCEVFEGPHRWAVQICC